MLIVSVIVRFEFVSLVLDGCVNLLFLVLIVLEFAF